MRADDVMSGGSHDTLAQTPGTALSRKFCGSCPLVVLMYLMPCAKCYGYCMKCPVSDVVFVNSICAYDAF